MATATKTRGPVREKGRTPSKKTDATKADAKTETKASAVRIPKALRERVEALLVENYAYMDSPSFKQKGIEKDLFEQPSAEPELPPTRWYQPTSQDLLDMDTSASPKLMSAAEERLMFMRFNYSKRKLVAFQAKIAKEGLTKELADPFLDWHRRYEHYRE